MTLKIYGIARSRASRTLWMAHELGVPFEHVPIAVADGGTASAAFLALNPNGRIPVIEDDGLVLFESAAINLYLAKRHGGPLGPRDLAEDARMTMWSVWAMADLEPDAHEVLVHTVNLPPQQRDQAQAAAAHERLKRPLGALERALTEGHGHLVGDRFTTADLNVAAVVFYLRGLPTALDATPTVAGWYRAITARAGFKAMLAARGEA